MFARLAKATLAVLAAVLISIGTQARDVPVIAAASSLSAAAPALARAFQDHTGKWVHFAFASSGNLTRQIRQGAPFEAFLSADPRYISTLVEQGFGEGEAVCYVLGRLVVFLNSDSPLELGVPSGALLDNLGTVLADPRLERLAIANPEHAPYGRATREALESIQLWNVLQPRLVVGENIAQAAQFAGASAVQAGIISKSLAVSAGLLGRGRYALLPQRLHQPLRHQMVLLRGASQATREFFAFVQSPRGREILVRHGFSTPERAGLPNVETSQMLAMDTSVRAPVWKSGQRRCVPWCDTRVH